MSQLANTEETSLTRLSPCPSYVHPEIATLIKKWYPGKGEILLFHKHLVQTLLEQQKSHAFLLNPINDNMFPEFTQLTLNKALKSVKPDDILIVDKTLNLYEIDLLSLDQIQSKFNLKKMDETSVFWVFMVMDKDHYRVSDFTMPIYLLNRLILQDRKPTEQIDQATLSVHASYSSLDIDLQTLTPIESLRIWKRMPDRNPSFFEKKIQFIKTFNILASSDTKHWDIIASESDFLIQNDKYYHTLFTNTNTPYRYIRINFLGENDRIFIHRIDVFKNP